MYRKDATTALYLHSSQCSLESWKLESERQENADLVFQVLLFEGSITIIVPLQEAVQKPEDRKQFPAVYRRVILGIILSTPSLGCPVRNCSAIHYKLC